MTEENDSETQEYYKIAVDGETESSSDAEKHEMTFEEASELIRKSRPLLLILEDLKYTNSQALYSLTMLSNWCSSDAEKCIELELPGAAENFRFMANLLEQASLGLMDVMFGTGIQPTIPTELAQNLADGTKELTYKNYKEAVLHERPIELGEDAHPANMLLAMHSNFEKLFAEVATAAQASILDGPEKLHDFYLTANANPLVAVATASAVVDRSYQMAAFGPEYWVFLPNDYRDTWRGTNISRIKPDDLATKFRIPCSFLHVSLIPGIPEDDSIPLETFANGQWAHLHDNMVTEYCFKSISEWIKAVK